MPDQIRSCNEFEPTTLSYFVVAWRKIPDKVKLCIAVRLPLETVDEWPELIDNVESFLRDLVAKGHPDARKTPGGDTIRISGFEIDPDGEMRIV